MITVGLDDTDLLDTPGTNHLARHLAHQLAPRWQASLITRHQLLQDPRVPCTRRNGCVAITFASADPESRDELAAAISEIMLPWCPVGSDPGLCLAAEVPEEVVAFGRDCQQRLMTQAEARGLAERQAIHLVGLGGTEDGVIGALAAVGLVTTRNDGRVILVGDSPIDHFDISGIHEVARLSTFGVDATRTMDDNQPALTGRVDVGKRLRPNFRGGKVVLYVAPSEQEGVDWYAQRVL